MLYRGQITIQVKHVLSSFFLPLQSKNKQLENEMFAATHVLYLQDWNLKKLEFLLTNRLCMKATDK